MELAINGETKLVGLVGGDTITQSFSPMMHTASFKEVGVNAVYLSLPIEMDQLKEVVAGLKDIAVGYNVIMPFKTYICEYMDELSPAAKLMGAVNTVEIRDGKCIGHNTDGAGFVENIKNVGFDPKGKIATVIGAGGAGSAVFTQLALEQVEEIYVYNIKDSFWDSTEKRVAQLAEHTGVKVSLHDLNNRDELKESIFVSDLLVNATKVGSGELEGQSSIDEEMLHECLVVADTVYKPLETKLIKMAKDYGLVTAGGVGMLLQQAALAEKIWFGTDMPVAYIEKNFF